MVGIALGCCASLIVAAMLAIVLQAETVFPVLEWDDAERS